MKATLHKILLLFGAVNLYTGSFVAIAQKSPGIPMPSGPIDLSKTSNLVIFIIIPAIILIVWLIYRKRIKKIKEEKREFFKKKNDSENS